MFCAVAAEEAVAADSGRVDDCTRVCDRGVGTTALTSCTEVRPGVNSEPEAHVPDRTQDQAMARHAHVARSTLGRTHRTTCQQFVRTELYAFTTPARWQFAEKVDSRLSRATLPAEPLVGGSRRKR